MRGQGGYARQALQSSGRTAVRRREEARAAEEAHAARAAEERAEEALRCEREGSVRMKLKSENSALEATVAGVRADIVALRERSAASVARAREVEVENARVAGLLDADQSANRDRIASFVERETAAAAALAAERVRLGQREAPILSDISALKAHLAMLVADLGDMPALRQENTALEEEHAALSAQIVKGKLQPLHDRLTRHLEAEAERNERLGNIRMHLAAKLQRVKIATSRTATERDALRLRLEAAEAELAAAVEERSLGRHARAPALAHRRETRAEMLARLGAMLRGDEVAAAPPAAAPSAALVLQSQALERDAERRDAAAAEATARPRRAAASPAAPRVRIDRSGNITIRPAR
jgi:hypothetical protein